MHGGDIYRNKVELDFSVNINPLGMPEGVGRALEAAVRSCQCYPDPRWEKLRHAISDMTGAEEEEILCGNGASELFLAIARGIMPGRTLIPVPSFSGYERAAVAAQGEIIFHEMRADREFCLAGDVLRDLTEDIDLVFLANPNNPVGNRIPPEALEELLRHCREKDIVAVLDECFIEFTRNGEADSFLRRVKEFPNLIVVRAFTKFYGIPGVRLGYLACADPLLRAKIAGQLPEWNVSVLAQEAGAAAARESLFREETFKLVERQRAYLAGQLREMGMHVYDSDANYLLFFTQAPLWGELLKRGILIRDCSDFRGLGKGFYRIAVKREEENKRLIDNIRGIYGEFISFF